MVDIKRKGIDRRAHGDRRKVYDLDYFLSNGGERRSGKDRRTSPERRTGWIETSDWSSVYLGSIVCERDFESRKAYHLTGKSGPRPSPEKLEGEGEHLRSKLQGCAYAVLGPRSLRVGRIVDISRDGLTLIFPKPAEQPGEPETLDIMIIGEDFCLDKVPFRTLTEREVDITYEDHALTMVRCEVAFAGLTEDQTSRLEHVIDRCTTSELSIDD